MGSQETKHYVTSITINSNNSLDFIADNFGGISVVAISNPTIPELILNTYHTKTENVVLNSDETLEFTADGSRGMNIIDIQGLK